MKARRCSTVFRKQSGKFERTDASGTYRAVYVVQLGGSIYVLHAFLKKAKSGIATPKRELDMIRRRLQLARRLAGRKGTENA